MSGPTPPKDVKSKPGEMIMRGHFNASPAGTAAFVGLRALDPVLQYNLLNGWGASLLAKLGLSAISTVGPTFHTGIAAVDSLGLSFHRLVLVGMSAGCAAKHIYWLTMVCNEEFKLPFSFMVSGYNSFLNSIYSILFVASATSTYLASPQFTVPVIGQTVSLPFAVGTLLYTAGIALETISEEQRKIFKKKSTNKGKICTTGLWSWARHINYTGYTMWRTGYAMAAGGWIPAALVLGFQAINFLQQGIENLDGYMTEKYGAQWEKYKTDTPWKMIPGLF